MCFSSPRDDTDVLGYGSVGSQEQLWSWPKQTPAISGVHWRHNGPASVTLQRASRQWRWKLSFKKYPLVLAINSLDTQTPYHFPKYLPLRSHQPSPLQPTTCNACIVPCFIQWPLCSSSCPSQNLSLLLNNQPSRTTCCLNLQNTPRVQPPLPLHCCHSAPKHHFRSGFTKLTGSLTFLPGYILVY